jgi:hypothetical protein
VGLYLSRQNISQWKVILHNRGHLIGTSGRMYGSTYIYGSGNAATDYGGPESEITKSDVTYLNTKKSRCLINENYANFKRKNIGHNKLLVINNIHFYFFS